MKTFAGLLLFSVASLLGFPRLIAFSSASATVATVNLYTVADGGGDDLNRCTRLRPCATVEAACALVPKDVDRPYVIHVGGGTYSAGCHLLGIRQVNGPDYANPGSVTVECAQNLYAPADGGTGTVTLGSVAAGSGATRDVWTVTGGTFNADELKGYQAQVYTGTGAAAAKWPITTNTDDDITIAGVSGGIGPSTAPAAGSTVRLWTRAALINGALTDTVTPTGYPPQTAVGAAFVVSAAGKGMGSDAVSPVVRIRGCKFGSGAPRGVLFQGPVAFEENECAVTTSSCFRGMDGVSWPASQRNVLTGSGTHMVMGNTALGSFAPSVQLYNNFSTTTVGNLFGGGQVGLFLSGMNEVTTSDAIRVNSILDGVSKYDKLTTSSTCLRSPLTASPTDVGAGVKLDFVGLSCTNSGTYSINLAGRGNRVELDATSTVTSANHHGAVSRDAQLWWASGTTWNGAGSDDFCETATGACLTEAAAVSGATAKYQCNDHGGCIGIAAHAGLLYSPVVAPIGSTSGADGQMQLCAGAAAATNGASSVTFASVARCASFSGTPSCDCSEGSDGGTPSIPCQPLTVSSTAVTFRGDPNFASHTHYWKCSGPK